MAQKVMMKAPKVNTIIGLLAFLHVQTRALESRLERERERHRTEDEEEVTESDVQNPYHFFVLNGECRLNLKSTNLIVRNKPPQVSHRISILCILLTRFLNTNNPHALQVSLQIPTMSSNDQCLVPVNCRDIALMLSIKDEVPLPVDEKRQSLARSSDSKSTSPLSASGVTCISDKISESSTLESSSLQAQNMVLVVEFSTLIANMLKGAKQYHKETGVAAVTHLCDMMEHAAVLLASISCTNGSAPGSQLVEGPLLEIGAQLLRGVERIVTCIATTHRRQTRVRRRFLKREIIVERERKRSAAALLASKKNAGNQVQNKKQKIVEEIGIYSPPTEKNNKQKIVEEIGIYSPPTASNYDEVQRTTTMDLDETCKGEVDTPIIAEEIDRHSIISRKGETSDINKGQSCEESSLNNTIKDTTEESSVNSTINETTQKKDRLTGIYTKTNLCKRIPIGKIRCRLLSNNELFRLERMRDILEAGISAVRLRARVYALTRHTASKYRRNKFGTFSYKEPLKSSLKEESKSVNAKEIGNVGNTMINQEFNSCLSLDTSTDNTSTNTIEKKISGRKAEDIVVNNANHNIEISSTSKQSESEILVPQTHKLISYVANENRPTPPVPAWLRKLSQRKFVLVSRAATLISRILSGYLPLRSPVAIYVSGDVFSNVKNPKKIDMWMQMSTCDSQRNTCERRLSMQRFSYWLSHAVDMYRSKLEADKSKLEADKVESEEQQIPKKNVNNPLQNMGDQSFQNDKKSQEIELGESNKVHTKNKLDVNSSPKTSKKKKKNTNEKKIEKYPYSSVADAIEYIYRSMQKAKDSRRKNSTVAVKPARNEKFSKKIGEIEMAVARSWASVIDWKQALRGNFKAGSGERVQLTKFSNLSHFAREITHRMAGHKLNGVSFHYVTENIVKRALLSKNNKKVPKYLIWSRTQPDIFQNLWDNYFEGKFKQSEEEK